MKSMTQSPAPVKPGRTMRVLMRGKNRVAFRISDASTGNDAAYSMTRIGSDFGVAFVCRKLGTGADPYHVNVENGVASCDCIDHLQRGHRRPCRHASAALALLARGHFKAS